MFCTLTRHHWCANAHVGLHGGHQLRFSHLRLELSTCDHPRRRQGLHSLSYSSILQRVQSRPAIYEKLPEITSVCLAPALNHECFLPFYFEGHWLQVPKPSLLLYFIRHLCLFPRFHYHTSDFHVDKYSIVLSELSSLQNPDLECHKWFPAFHRNVVYNEQILSNGYRWAASPTTLGAFEENLLTTGIPEGVSIQMLQTCLI